MRPPDELALQILESLGIDTESMRITEATIRLAVDTIPQVELCVELDEIDENTGELAVMKYYELVERKDEK